MLGTKMRWTKPQLIVLARGMPEESVLTHCKTENPNVAPVVGPADLLQQASCAHGIEYPDCSNCQSRAFNAT